MTLAHPRGNVPMPGRARTESTNDWQATAIRLAGELDLARQEIVLLGQRNEAHAESEQLKADMDHCEICEREPSAMHAPISVCRHCYDVARDPRCAHESLDTPYGLRMRREALEAVQSWLSTHGMRVSTLGLDLRDWLAAQIAEAKAGATFTPAELDDLKERVGKIATGPNGSEPRWYVRCCNVQIGGIPMAQEQASCPECKTVWRRPEAPGVWYEDDHSPQCPVVRATAKAAPVEVERLHERHSAALLGVVERLQGALRNVEGERDECRGAIHDVISYTFGGPCGGQDAAENLRTLPARLKAGATEIADKVSRYRSNEAQWRADAEREKARADKAEGALANVERLARRTALEEVRTEVLSRIATIEAYVQEPNSITRAATDNLRLFSAWLGGWIETI